MSESARRPITTTNLVTFAVTIFAGATLFFSCEPIVARMIDALLGGAPSVWIVCSLMFQTLLLAGYTYAHFAGTRLPVRVQVVMQFVLIGAVFLVMPVAVDEGLVQRVTPAIRPSASAWCCPDDRPRSSSCPRARRCSSAGLPSSGRRTYHSTPRATPAASWRCRLSARPRAAPAGAWSEPSASRRVRLRYAVLVVVCAVTALRRSVGMRIDQTPALPPAPHDRELTPVKRNAKPQDEPFQRWRQRVVWVLLSFAAVPLLLGATEYP